MDLFFLYYLVKNWVRWSHCFSRADARWIKTSDDDILVKSCPQRLTGPQMTEQSSSNQSDATPYIFFCCLPHFVKYIYRISHSEAQQDSCVGPTIYYR